MPRVNGSNRFFAVLLIALLTAVNALAVDSNALALEADRLYKEKKYKEARDMLLKAYEANPQQAVYLYNIARSFDQENMEKEALEYYRKYVSQPADRLKPDLLNRSNLSMDRLRSSIAKAEAAETVQEADKRRLETEALNSKKRAEAEAERARHRRAEFEAKERETQQAAGKKASGRKTAAFVVGGVGLAALGVGTTFGILATNSRAAFGRAATVDDKRLLESDTKTQALVADISFLAAIAAATTAVILFPKTEDAGASISMSLIPTSGGAFASLGGSF